MSLLKAFSNTKIDAFKTQNDLEQLLSKRGIRASRWTHFAEDAKTPGKMRFEFEWQPPIVKLGEAPRQPLGFRIEVEYKGELGPNGGQRGTTREQGARALYWHVKNLFDAIDFGIVEMEQAFLPYLLTAGDLTVYERLSPRLAELQSGDLPPLLGDGRREASR